MLLYSHVLLNLIMHISKCSCMCSSHVACLVLVSSQHNVKAKYVFTTALYWICADKRQLIECAKVILSTSTNSIQDISTPQRSSSAVYIYIYNYTSYRFHNIAMSLYNINIIVVLLLGMYNTVTQFVWPFNLPMDLLPLPLPSPHTTCMHAHTHIHIHKNQLWVYQPLSLHFPTHQPRLPYRGMHHQQLPCVPPLSYRDISWSM